MKWRGDIIITSLLAIEVICFFGYILHSRSSIFRDFQGELLSVEWPLLVCLSVWCGTFIFLTFSLNDLPLVGLLLIVIIAFFTNYLEFPQIVDTNILLAGMTLGKGAKYFLKLGVRKGQEINGLAIKNQNWAINNFQIGLLMLLAFSSWWHLDTSDNFYHGPRWMGIWDNPNIYGTLMEVGVVLAAGVLSEMENGEWRMENLLKPLSIIVIIAILMMGIGLIFSYSRGSWLGTAIGLLYLAKAYGKFKWQYVLPEIIAMVAVIWFFWNTTPDSAPWYVKRMDLSRPSAQHRVVAWKAGFEIMRDHPFGVGWNKTVETYQDHYSPPPDGAAAITTNDYLMIGTQLGIPALFCFIAYIALCFGARNWWRKKSSPTEDCGLTTPDPKFRTPHSALRTKLACRAAALSLVVAFWFDGGLFELPTAAVFWVLLELGREDLPQQNVIEKNPVLPANSVA